MPKEEGIEPGSRGIELEKIDPKLSELEGVLRQISEQMKQLQNAHLVKPEDRLLDIDGVAEYLGISKYSAQRDVVTRPDCPASVKPCKQPRWFQGDIVAWARQNKSKTPKPRSRKAA